MVMVREDMEVIEDAMTMMTGHHIEEAAEGMVHEALQAATASPSDHEKIEIATAATTEEETTTTADPLRGNTKVVMTTILASEDTEYNDAGHLETCDFNRPFIFISSAFLYRSGVRIRGQHSVELGLFLLAK